MTITSGALSRAGIHLGSRTFSALADEAIRRLHAAKYVPEPVDELPLDRAAALIIPTFEVAGRTAHGELTPDEVAALVRGGGTPEPTDLGEEDPLARTAAEYAALIATSLSVQQAAKRLEVFQKEIQRRLAEHTLYGVKLEGEWYILPFQFAGGRLLPGIDKVIPRLDPRLHPVTVYIWSTTQNPDLVIDDEPVSPRDWLLRHDGNEQSVEAVAALAAQL